MRIVRISLWRVPLASHTAYHMSDGKTCDTVDSVILRLDTDGGPAGWGEVCPIPHYLPAYAGGVAPAIVIYYWSTAELGGIGWAIALIYAKQR